MLMGRDDCLRSLRMLLREVVRNVKHDMIFHTFAVSLMHDHSDTKLRDLDPILKASLSLSDDVALLFRDNFSINIYKHKVRLDTVQSF